MAQDNQITLVGKTNFHNSQKLFGIKLDDRRRHMHIMGKTGMGKTSLLLNMVVSDIKNGHGLAYIDPHGDTADNILNYIPPERMKDVVYFNPSDLDFPIAFNVLGDVPVNQRHIVADGLVGVFQKLWADSWGPRLEYILRNTIMTLLEFPESTLLDIMKILVDKDYRKSIVNQLQDQVVKSFWVNEFNKYSEKMLTEAISPIQNKVGQFTSSTLIRNIIGQQKSSIDIREIMDNRKILIMNLSKGAVGEGGAQLLGAMMITKLQLAAMSRVNIAEDDRKDFFAYVDEFQNFSTDSFAEILSEARKYRLCLILAHQYLEQLSEKVLAGILGNVGTTIIFRIGAGDSEMMEKEFGPTLLAEDLVNLPKWKIYLKLMIDGVTSSPFSADTLPDPPREPGNLREEIIAMSREQFGRPKESIQQMVDEASMLPERPDAPQGGGKGSGQMFKPSVPKFVPSSAAVQPKESLVEPKNTEANPAVPQLQAISPANQIQDIAAMPKNNDSPNNVADVIAQPAESQVLQSNQKELNQPIIAVQERQVVVTKTEVIREAVVIENKKQPIITPLVQSNAPIVPKLPSPAAPVKREFNKNGSNQSQNQKYNAPHQQNSYSYQGQSSQYQNNVSRPPQTNKFNNRPAQQGSPPQVRTLREIATMVKDMDDEPLTVVSVKPASQQIVEQKPISTQNQSFDSKKPGILLHSTQIHGRSQNPEVSKGPTYSQPESRVSIHNVLSESLREAGSRPPATPYTKVSESKEIQPFQKQSSQDNNVKLIKPGQIIRF